MRIIYYVPEGESIDDYKSEWDQVVAEVHVGLSPNIEDYIKDPTKAQVVEIPEYRKAHIPVNAASKDFIQYVYIDEFFDKDETPQYKMEIWSKNLDKPSETHVKIDTHILQYDNFKKHFYSEHISLAPGWYDVVFFRDGEEVESKEIAVYEASDEQE